MTLSARRVSLPAGLTGLQYARRSRHNHLGITGGKFLLDNRLSALHGRSHRERGLRKLRTRFARVAICWLRDLAAGLLRARRAPSLRSGQALAMTSGTEPHPPHEADKLRGGPDAIEPRVNPKKGHLVISLGVGPVQPLQRRIILAQPEMDHTDVVG